MGRILGLFLFLGLQGGLWAHPHLNFQARVQFNYDQGKPVSLTTDWWMDRFFSASIIHDYDRDKDGAFSPSETARVHAEAFSHLKNLGYMIYFRKGNQKTSPKSVRDFSVRQESGILVYRFTIDIPPANREELNMAVFDTSFYTGITYLEPGIFFTGLDESAASPQWEVVEDRDRPVYYNPMDPATSTKVYTRMQPGLLIAYPMEVRVRG